jgi:hypothetical protein
MLDLTPGARLLLDEVEWTVESFAAPYGRVVLGGGGRQMHMTVRTLVNHPRCRPLPRPGAVVGDRRGQPVELEDLTEQQRQQVLLRVAHLLEAETGFRGGDPLRPVPGEPRDGYDPAVTTVECQRSPGSPRWWSVDLPGGGQGCSPLAAMAAPRTRSWFSPPVIR